MYIFTTIAIARYVHRDKIINKNITWLCDLSYQCPLPRHSLWPGMRLLRGTGQSLSGVWGSNLSMVTLQHVTFCDHGFIQPLWKYHYLRKFHPTIFASCNLYSLTQKKEGARNIHISFSRCLKFDSFILNRFHNMCRYVINETTALAYTHNGSIAQLVRASA